MTWSVNSTLTDDELDRNSTLYAEELAQWRNNGTGRLTQTSLTHIIFGRVGANESIWSDAEVAEGDPAGGEGAPHYEQIVSVRVSSGGASTYQWADEGHSNRTSGRPSHSHRRPETISA